MTLTLNLPSKLGDYVAAQVAQGFYADEEEVIRDAVRRHAGMDFSADSTALEAMLLEGVRSSHEPLTDDVWASIRQRAAQLTIGA
jgi:putative addiction module CopG family antidote